MTLAIDPAYLRPTAILDSDHPTIAEFVERTVDDPAADPLARAVKLYYAVRDDIRYDPYSPFYRPDHYRASNVLKNGRGYCVSKAALLCALGRAAEIPSRVGFATVKNHLATRQLLDYLGSDLFVYHGYTDFFLNGRWVKATPAFNRQLCRHFKVPPLDFDGRSDAVFHAYNNEQQPFMEYVADHGTYADIPVGRILAAWRDTYGEDRVARWIAAFETPEGLSGRDFQSEEIVA